MLRSRSLALPLLLAAALLAAAPAPASASATTQTEASPVEQSAAPASLIRLTPAPAYALVSVHAAVASHRSVPSTPDSKHLAPFMAFAAAAATKRPTRRSRGVTIPDVPMFLDSDVHVMRDGEMTVIRGGVLVEDTELEDDEVADLVRLKVVRPATTDELARLDASATMTAREDLVRQQEADVAALTASHDAAIASMREAGKSDSAIAKQAEKNAAELTALRDQHAGALNA